MYPGSSPGQASILFQNSRLALIGPKMPAACVCPASHRTSCGKRGKVISAMTFRPILIVDDDAFMRDLGQIQLEAAGFSVETCDNGADAGA